MGASMETVQVSIELPLDIFSALRQDPAGFVREMRVAAAVKWYENSVISQSKAAEIAGLSRAEFINALKENEKMVRIPTHRQPTHPGEMLLEEFLNPMGLTSAILPTRSMFPISESTILSTAAAASHPAPHFGWASSSTCPQISG